MLTKFKDPCTSHESTMNHRPKYIFLTSLTLQLRKAIVTTYFFQTCRADEMVSDLSSVLIWFATKLKLREHTCRRRMFCKAADWNKNNKQELIKILFYKYYIIKWLTFVVQYCLLVVWLTLSYSISNEPRIRKNLDKLFIIFHHVWCSQFIFIHDNYTR